MTGSVERRTVQEASCAEVRKFESHPSQINELCSRHWGTWTPCAWNRPSQTDDLKIDTCPFLTRRSALLGQGKDWWVQCQDNVTVYKVSDEMRRTGNVGRGWKWFIVETNITMSIFMAIFHTLQRTSKSGALKNCIAWFEKDYISK